MKIGIITDRLSADPGEAIRMASELGADFAEIRGAGGRRIPSFTSDETRAIGMSLCDFGLPALALSPGTFRCSLYDREFAEQPAIFDHTLDLAVEWGAKAIITNGVRRHWKDRRGDYRRLTDTLSKCVLAASAKGIQVWLENDFGWFNDAPDNILRMQKVMSGMGVKTCWNIAGYYSAGAGDWRGFLEAIGDGLACVHLSDIFTVPTQRAHFPVEELLRGVAAQPGDTPVVIDGTGSPDPERAAQALRWTREACGAVSGEL